MKYISKKPQQNYITYIVMMPTQKVYSTYIHITIVPYFTQATEIIDKALWCVISSPQIHFKPQGSVFVRVLTSSVFSSRVHGSKCIFHTLTYLSTYPCTHKEDWKNKSIRGDLNEISITNKLRSMGNFIYKTTWIINSLLSSSKN